MERCMSPIASRVALSLVTATTLAAAPATSTALDWAFKFASAIHADPKDMGKAQEAVVREYSARGELDEALERAQLIQGWRRGTALADLAADFAAAGRTDEAHALVAKAEAYRRGVEGWENPRIQAHVARALARLGEVDRSREIARGLAESDPEQYTGGAAAAVATALAAQGLLDAALARLAQLDADTDFDVAWSRTLGYVEIARLENLSKEQRARALQAAGRSAAGVPGWKSGEAWLLVADEYQALGDRRQARAATNAASASVRELPATMEVTAPLVSRLAGAWAEIGEKRRARELLAGLEAGVPQTLVTRQPESYAAIAAAYLAIRDDAQARRLYDRALAAAADLENARPRALAVVAVCNSMGRSGLSLDDSTLTRLETLYSNLGDPW
jgi:tetratricopeptide (TPR) repeat protein